MAEIGYPFWLTGAKCLKTLAGGDPYGVAISAQFQLDALASHPDFGRLIPLETSIGWLTNWRPA